MSTTKSKNMYFMAYKYILRPRGQRDLPDGASPETGGGLVGEAQRIFYGLFPEGADPVLPIVQQKRGGAGECLPNSVLAKADNVAVLNVNNVKMLKKWEGHDEMTVESHPGCFVLIDNREGVAQMLIERTASFGNKPDTVAALLQEALNRKLFDYGLEVEIRNKMRPVTFWQLVHRRRSHYQDAVKSVTFHLDTPDKVAGIDANRQAMERLKCIAYYCDRLKGCRSSLLIEAGSDQSLQLDQTMEDIAELVSLCSNNAFSIEVRFQHYGVYRFGEKEKACLQVSGEALWQFLEKTGQGCLFGDRSAPLLGQLDMARTITEGYEETPIVKRRKAACGGQLQEAPSLWAASGGAQ